MFGKRKTNRHRKRLTLRFGKEAATQLAFTEDISATGIFVKATAIVPPGTRIVLEVKLPDETTVKLEGIVAWAKKAPPQLVRIARKCGMGVHITRFVSGENEYLAYVSAGARG